MNRVSIDSQKNIAKVSLDLSRDNSPHGGTRSVRLRDVSGFKDIFTKNDLEDKIQKLKLQVRIKHLREIIFLLTIHWFSFIYQSVGIDF